MVCAISQHFAPRNLGARLLRLPRLKQHGLEGEGGARQAVDACVHASAETICASQSCQGAASSQLGSLEAGALSFACTRRLAARRSRDVKAQIGFKARWIITRSDCLARSDRFDWTGGRVAVVRDAWDRHKLGGEEEFPGRRLDLMDNIS